jgi:AraC-like DNA-binding protein
LVHYRRSQIIWEILVLPLLDIGEFLARPLGRYVGGGSFIIWVYSPTLVGNVYFGQPDMPDLIRLARMYDLPRSRALSPPFDVVMDGSRMAAMDPLAFEALSRYVDEKLDGFVPLVRRMAVIRPEGLPGATLGGLFHDILAPRLAESALFTEMDEGFRWLGTREAQEALTELRPTIEAVVGAPEKLRELHIVLDASIQTGKLSLEDIARHVRLSPRALQRLLQQNRTSFRTEVDRARVRLAADLLLRTQMKLETIAARVGCASLSHFSVLFSRVAGESPSDFRRKRVETAGSR